MKHADLKNIYRPDLKFNLFLNFKERIYILMLGTSTILMFISCLFQICH